MAISGTERLFFMGSNTPGGFVGNPQGLYDGAKGWRAFLIQSGPGTGKSTLLKRVATEMAAEGHEVDLLLCSSDPHSLDGVWMPDIRACVLDATAPHAVEPSCFGAVERIVPLGEALQSEPLTEARGEIAAASGENAEAHRRVRRFMSAAATLLADNTHLAETGLDKNKVIRSADRMAARELEDAPADGFEGEQRRFLTALTPEGLQTLFGTATALCPRLFALDDEYGVFAPLYLETVRRKALSLNLPFYACPSPLFPDRPEHLLFPTLGVAFLTSDRRHPVDFPVYRHIHATRFLDAEAVTDHRNRLRFHQRVAHELLAESVAASRLAKQWHDRMEAPYIAAMDWEMARAMGDDLLRRLRQL